MITNTASLDYVEIDAASHTGVDNIREEILDKALYPPTALKKKIYVIDEVHMLSKGAFNALLKIIEEPKGNVCFILATTEINKVPDTIISRCQVFHFKRVADGEIATHLAYICDKEGFTYEKEALDLIANISDGGVRDSVKYLDQVSVLWAVTQEHVSRFLGISSEVQIRDFLMLIKKGERNQIFQTIEQINEHGIDFHQFAKQVIGFIDKHLLEDIDFYLQVSEVFGAIMRQVRFYPYPAVVYKVELNKYLLPASRHSEESQTPNKEKIVNDEESLSKKKSDEVLVAPTSTVTNNGDSSLQSPMAPSVQNDDTASNLRPTILSKLSKPTVQSNLKDHVIIEKVEGSVVHLVVTNKIAEMLLQNAEHKKEIETLFTNELWTPMTVSFVFETKEEYFARTLGI